MIKISIENIEYFDKFLHSILKFTNMCKFEIDSKKCIVRSKNLIARSFFTSNVIKTDTEDDSVLSFCIGELQHLCKSIRTLKEFSTHNKATLIYDKPFIKLNDVIKFKLSTIDESKIESTLTEDIRTELTSLYSCQISSVMMRKLASMSFMADECPKVYLYKENDKIMGEIDDKAQDLSNSITIPLTGKYTGDWENILITDLDSFRLWNILDSSDVNVSYEVNGPIKVILINSEDKTPDGIYVKVKMLSSVLKK